MTITGSTDPPPPDIGDQVVADADIGGPFRPRVRRHTPGIVVARAPAGELEIHFTGGQVELVEPAKASPHSSPMTQLNRTALTYYRYVVIAVRGPTRMEPILIEARGLSKSYGDKLAVDDLSFTVRPGITTGFLGPRSHHKASAASACRLRIAT